MVCPFCGSKRYIKLHTYSAAEIVKKYKDTFMLDVGDSFSSEQLELHQCVECYLEYFCDGGEGDSSFYAKLSKHPWYYAEDKSEYDYAIKKLLQVKPQSVLEIGSGRGLFLDRIKASFDVRATEQNPVAIQELQKKGVLLDDGESSYDFVVSFQVFEHVKDLSAFMKWVTEKVKENGHLLITVPNPDAAYMKEVFQILDFPPHHVQRFPKESLYKIAEMLGMEVKEYFQAPISDVHLAQLLYERQKNIRVHAGLEKNSDFVMNMQVAMATLCREENRIAGHTHGVLLQKI